MQRPSGNRLTVPPLVGAIGSGLPLTVDVGAVVLVVVGVVVTVLVGAGGLTFGPGGLVGGCCCTCSPPQATIDVVTMNDAATKAFLRIAE